MRLGIVGIVLAAFVTLIAPPARAEEGKDAAAIIAKAVEARGGKANLAKYKAQTAKFKGQISISGMDISMTGTSKSQSPDKMHVESEAKAGGQDFSISQIINGDKGWQGVNGMFTDMDKETLEEGAAELYASRIADLMGMDDKKLKFEALGKSTVDDKPAIGVKVTSKGQRDISVFFDAKTHQVVKTETTGKDQMNGGALYKSETFYSDYKKVGPLTLPHSVKVLRDGKPFMKMEMSDTKVLEKLDDSEFSKPAA
jgi:hypothetical protein